MIKQIFMIAVLALSTNAFAKDITVHGEAVYQGDNVIRLRTLANQVLNQKLSNFELVGVTMKAKSRKGHGKATLVIGNDQSQKLVDQFGDDIFFLVGAPWSFHTIRWNISNMPGQADERWQIHLQGTIRVDEIKLHLREVSQTNRVRIALGNQLFTGENTVHLRQELKALGHNVRGDKLRRVVLVAKSRAGNASAGVQVGQQFSNAKTIGQTQSGLPFASNEAESYNRLAWNFNGRTPGVWQLHMKGRIKVKAVIVEYED